MIPLDQTCEKCGHSGCELRYCSGVQQSSYRSGYCPKANHIHVICTTCHYDAPVEVQ